MAFCVGDPFEVSPSELDQHFARSSPGRKCPIRDGVLDCRPLPTQTTHKWQLRLEVQLDFASWSAGDGLNKDLCTYLAERDTLVPGCPVDNLLSKRAAAREGSCGLLHSGAPLISVDPHRDVPSEVRDVSILIVAHPFCLSS